MYAHLGVGAKAAYPNCKSAKDKTRASSDLGEKGRIRATKIGSSAMFEARNRLKIRPHFQMSATFAHRLCSMPENQK